MYNVDDHNTTVNINIDRESDLKEDTDDNKDLYLYVKTIIQYSKCYYWFMDSDASVHMINKNEYFIGDRKRVINRCVKVGGGRKILMDLIGKAMIEIGNGKLIF